MTDFQICKNMNPFAKYSLYHDKPFLEMQLYSYSEILHFKNFGGGEAVMPQKAKKFSSLHACKISGPYRSPFFHTCRVDSSA